ncbi:MAG: DUF4382 domain-containing protein [Candidatus Liptonbacteria bacterium]|nr:DUF4382 domain-containing protein [Candidatus Liptonbacteria bacterium]
MNQKYAVIGIAALVLVGAVLLMNLPARAPAPAGGLAAAEPAGKSEIEGGIQTGIAPQAPAATPRPTANSGRVVFGVTDETAALGSFKSLFITVRELRVHSPQSGWVTVVNAPKRFDLLALDRSGTIALLSDANIREGNYGKISFTVGGIEITGFDGSSRSAKLPSGNLSFLISIEVRRGEATGVILDFDAAKSLHVTGDGEYLFFPVVSATSRGKAIINIGRDTTVNVVSGTVVNRATVGMDENGEVKENFELHPAIRLEYVGNVLKSRDFQLSEEGLAVPASRALELAIGGGHASAILTMKLVSSAGKPTWKMRGTKGTQQVNLEVSAETGAVNAVK